MDAASWMGRLSESAWTLPVMAGHPNRQPCRRPPSACRPGCPRPQVLLRQRAAVVRARKRIMVRDGSSTVERVRMNIGLRDERGSSTEVADSGVKLRLPPGPTSTVGLRGRKVERPDGDPWNLIRTMPAQGARLVGPSCVTGLSLRHAPFVRHSSFVRHAPSRHNTLHARCALGQRGTAVNASDGQRQGSQRPEP